MAATRGRQGGRGEVRDGPGRSAGGLWGVSTFFDFAGSAASLANLARFSRGVRQQGLRLLIVELAFGDADFRVPESYCDRLVRRHCADVMWQKERLINCGIAQLPPDCDKVVWLDADIAFDNPDWVAETTDMLDQQAVVQPFDLAAWLPRDEAAMPADPPFGLGEGKAMPGMAATMRVAADRRRALADYFRHGHTGFAWAARRDILQRHLLYDRHVLGGGDVTIAHAFYGDTDYWRGLNMFCRGLTKAEIASIGDWGRRLHSDVQGSIGFVPGRVVHFWHGATARRGYADRWRILKDNDYAPDTDVSLDSQDCLCWSSDKAGLHAGVRAYFAARGAAGQAAA
jgi:hypothetical protein